MPPRKAAGAQGGINIDSGGSKDREAEELKAMLEMDRD